MNKFRIGAILCAAGTSSRMPDHNKLLLPYRNTTVIAYIVDQLLATDMAQLIVVIGHEAEAVRLALSLYEDQITFVNNPRYQQGHTSSIIAGVSALREELEGFMICLSDMPALTKDHYDQLIYNYRSHHMSNDQLIVRPSFKGRPGHPVFFSMNFMGDIKACQENEGCRSVIQKHQNSLYLVPVEDAAFVLDIDTPDQYDQHIATIS